MTVEVKALTIGARQVTQGIFRQLIEEPLISTDGTLNGVPWGHVAWHPDKCENVRQEHRHIVWQSGNCLRRARIDVEPDFVFDSDLRGYRGTPADRLLTAWVREVVRGRSDKTLIVGPEQKAKGARLHTLEASVNAETGVIACAEMSDAAHRVEVLYRQAAQALDQVEEPLSETAEYRDLGGATARWLREHPQIARLVRPALEAGMKISLARGTDCDFEVSILGPVTATELGRAIRAEADSILGLLLEARGDRLTWLAQSREQLGSALAVLDAEVESWSLTWPEVKTEYEAAIRIEAARRQRHREAHIVLTQLPQLFIGG